MADDILRLDVTIDAEVLAALQDEQRFFREKGGLDYPLQTIASIWLIRMVREEKAKSIATGFEVNTVVTSKHELQ